VAAVQREHDSSGFSDEPHVIHTPSNRCFLNYCWNCSLYWSGRRGSDFAGLRPVCKLPKIRGAQISPIAKMGDRAHVFHTREVQKLDHWIG